jgi:hypothetical protein
MRPIGSIPPDRDTVASNVAGVSTVEVDLIARRHPTGS